MSKYLATLLFLTIFSSLCFLYQYQNNIDREIRVSYPEQGSDCLSCHPGWAGRGKGIYNPHTSKQVALNDVELRQYISGVGL